MQLAAAALRAVHIAGGVAALLTFLVPLVVRKGGLVHRRLGWVYVAAMFTAAVSAVLIAPIRMVDSSDR